MMHFKQFSVLAAATVLSAAVLPSMAHAGGGHDRSRTTIYFTRHAEKLTVVDEVSAGVYEDNCNSSRTRCEEALNEKGKLRAQFLAEWFEQRGIAMDVTHVISSDKQRTRQTVQPLADLIEEYGTVLPDTDGVMDGVQQVPEAGDKANETTSNSPSVGPTADFLNDLPLGSVAVIAAHSGTIYRIMGGEDADGDPTTGDDTVGLGIDTTESAKLFPRDDEQKVPEFGDVWKVVVREDRHGNRTAHVAWRKQLEFRGLRVSH